MTGILQRDEHAFITDDAASPDDVPEESRALPEPICALDAPPPTPIRWVVQDLFTAGDIGLIVGDGGSFKSSAALHIAAAVAGGYKAFDRFETGGGSGDGYPVLLCSAEDPGSVIQMRLEAFIRGHDWNRRQVMRHFHYFALAGIRLKDPRWKHHLVETVRILEPAMVILDPFVDLSGLEEENSNSEASGVMGFARQLARESQASVPFVHHASKVQDQRATRSQSRIRGATTIANASRGTLFFEFTPAGVIVEQVKMTYAEKVPTFVLTRAIDSEPTNRAQWISARLATERPEEARATKAELFILSQLLMSPGLNSRAIRDAAKGSGVFAPDLDKALKTLFSKGGIGFDSGPRNEKTWHVTEIGRLTLDRASETRHSQKNDRADRAGTVMARSNGTGSDRASPKGGHGHVTAHDRAEAEFAWPVEPPEDLEEFTTRSDPDDRWDFENE